MEFIITGLLILVSLFILYKNLKAKKGGSCSCCSKDCAHCHKAVLNTIEKK
ncbi:MAG: FeoB-associated Cys-rich membrane protein [Clostridium sp.]|uniref:FeoB-associated Cys-rich membrane protein n=1 Tax=Clostridium sp. TaxID=1506 RepID=UPI002A8E2C02|nr:FeoB-associated Cys-rich membrane protein [Clostridium sp.]MDY5097818.1 FeoB-associated Cys-rich membrane protein [Clostridium sp.]